jgi:hypothetical protein
MTNKNGKEKLVSLRMTNVIHSDITIYAKANGLNFSQAVCELLEEGIKAKNDPVAKKSDIDKLTAETELTRVALVEAIKNQPIEIQQQNLLEEELTKPKKSLLQKLFNA